ncbi:MAG TPA: NHL repeat-containing protein [Solirubrobacteraceae bacterium]
MSATASVAPAPVAWLGGPSAFGLALPDAAPTPSTLYAPRGVCLAGGALIAADTGNHRLLIWPDAAALADHAPAEVVVGKGDMTSEGPGLLFLPTGVLVHEGRLIVADAWHHRILIWDEVPRASGTAPDVVLGQAGLDGVTEGCGPRAFYWPFGVAVVDDVFWVADTGNRRVLGWSGGVPGPGVDADLLLGQPDFEHRGENRDGPVAADSLRWPHAVSGAAGRLAVADAGNHRVLFWRAPERGGPAGAVLGQPDFATAVEYPYRPQGPRAMRFPYGVADRGAELFVADTSNNRVLVLDDVGATLAGAPAGGAADRVLGQPDLDANGENRWDAVGADSLCWPYGLAVDGDLLAVADSGNNRVTLWSVPR